MNHCWHRPPCKWYKMEYMCFNQTGDISTQNDCSLKLVDRFTNLGSSVSSTETDINTRVAKAWTAIDKQLVIWKSDLTDKMKCSFFKQQSCWYCYMGHFMDTNKTYGEKTWWQLHKNATSNIEQLLEAAPHKVAAVQPPTTHHKNHQN